MRRAALEEAGGMDEGFFLYSEETDLFRRLRGQGWYARFEPNARRVPQCFGSAPWESDCPDTGSKPGPLRAQAPRCARRILEAIGVAIDALARAAAWAHRPARRRGHLAAARAALGAVHRPKACR